MRVGVEVGRGVAVRVGVRVGWEVAVSVGVCAASGNAESRDGVMFRRGMFESHAMSNSMLKMTRQTLVAIVEIALWRSSMVAFLYTADDLSRITRSVTSKAKFASMLQPTSSTGAPGCNCSHCNARR